MELQNLIVRKIREKGPISFRDFMDAALYQPGLGFYSSSDPRIGKRGDFFTSPYISSAFGAMIGRQIEEIWHEMRHDFVILEYGAGSGLLCHDILEYLKTNPVCYKQVRYVIIEKSPVLRKLSQIYLTDKVSWIDDIHELGSFEGCIISNELFDNFPVHKVFQKGEELLETLVDFNDGFCEVAKPAAMPIIDYFGSIRLKFSDGDQTEVCLDAKEWFVNISKFLKRGYIISIDYGYRNEHLRHKNKIEGTIRSYKNHRLGFDPYKDPGQQDITADVNFSALIYWGVKSGFEFTGFISQHLFLRALGFIAYLSDMSDTEENKKFACSMLLNRMGTRFHVLIQRKNLSYRALRGLSLAYPQEKHICSDAF